MPAVQRPKRKRSASAQSMPPTSAYRTRRTHKLTEEDREWIAQHGPGV